MMDAIAPTIMPVRGKKVRKGFYIARRRNWASESSWVVVMVLGNEQSGDRLKVYEAGSDRIDPVREWIFHSRVAGMERMPSTKPKHAKIEDAITIH